MARLIWAPAAIKDVARLHRFLASKDRQAAQRTVRAIRGGVRTVAAHPEIGCPIEDMPVELRRWFVPFGSNGYVVLYRHDPELTIILAVRHGREAGYY